jgi:hypothetical protein
MIKYLYFVSYVFTAYDGRTGTGNIFFEVAGQIENMETIRDIEKKINDGAPFVSCAIINFIKIKECAE